MKTIFLRTGRITLTGRLPTKLFLALAGRIK